MREYKNQYGRQKKGAKNVPAAVGKAVVDLLFPRRCPVCGDVAQPPGHLICPECVAQLSPVRQPSCKKCGKEVESRQTEYCPDCMRRTRTWEQNFALLNYNAAASRSMAAIKYKGRREYLDFYSEAACRRFARQFARICPDGIVPVPIHSSRMRTRGFNQAELLADRLGKHLGIPVYPDGLKRVKKTLPQKELNQEARFKNLQQAFMPGQLPPHVKTVLLADDIYTTGSTMEACSRALKAMGVEQIYGLTLCIGQNG